MALLLGAWCASAWCQSTLDRVAGAGVVRCAGVERPGLAQDLSTGHGSGLLVDICRAVATAILGSPDRVAFRGYVSEADFDRVRRGADDLYFLTGAEINAHALAGFVLPGPTVFIAAHGVMVPAGAPELHLGAMAGTGICFRIGEPAERSLEAWFERNQAAWLRHAFSEDGEMMDAYAVQRCHGVAGELGWLAHQRRAGGARLAGSRILPEPLNVFPLVAATGTGDARWAAVVAWTINTLVNADRPETTWYAGGPRAMPVTAPQLGLTAGWQARVIAATGSYRSIFARHLGADSGLHLEGRSLPQDQPGDSTLMPYVE